MSARQTDWLQTKPPAREPAQPAIAEVIRKRTILDVIAYAQECAGLEEKQVYDPLGWSKEVWSRIFNPDSKNPAYFDARRLVPFMELTNNAPLIWLAHHRGFNWSTIRPYLSDVEAENERLRAENAELRRQREIEINYQRELERRR